jgi:hypothetical protein
LIADLACADEVRSKICLYSIMVAVWLAGPLPAWSIARFQGRWFAEGSQPLDIEKRVAVQGPVLEGASKPRSD